MKMEGQFEIGSRKMVKEKDRKLDGFFPQKDGSKPILTVLQKATLAPQEVVE